MSEAQIWDRFAKRYDAISRVFDWSYPRIRARLDRDLPSGAAVLEVAAGTGEFTEDLARRAGRVVATDVSPNMVEALTRRLASSGLANVDVELMSAYELDAPEASFDAVFCANALHVMDDPQCALAEFRRVLRDDGVLIVPTFLHGTDRVRSGLSHAMSLVSPFVAKVRFDLDALVSLVGGAGFEVVHAERMPGPFALGYVVARPAGG